MYSWKSLALQQNSTVMGRSLKALSVALTTGFSLLVLKSLSTTCLDRLGPLDQDALLSFQSPCHCTKFEVMMIILGC